MPFLEKTGYRGVKFAGALCALAAWLLFGAAQRAPAATPSNVQYTAVSSASVSVSWTLDNPAAETPFMAVSTMSDFSVWLSSASGALGQQSASYSITDNTTYYFKVKVSTEPDAAYSAYITTLTLAAVPAAVYFDEVSTISITAAAYASPPAFVNLGAGSSGMNIAIDTDTWTWSGWHGEKWTGKTVVTTGRFTLAAAAVGGKIYAIGGYNSSWVIVATNEEYDPASNNWVARTAMPTARVQPAAAVAGGKIYVMGGYPGTTINEEYDPAANTWTSKAAMPIACNYPTAAAVGGRIYVLGGDPSPYNQNNEYNPATDSWASKTPVPSMRGGSAAAVVGGRIYIMGSQYTTYKSANDEYYPVTNSWITKTAMPTGRCYLAAAAVGGRIYAIGGADPYSGDTTAINDEYDPATNTWVSRTAMPTARRKLAAAAVGGRIYVLGGQTSPYNQNDEYDPGRASKFTPLVPNTQYSFKAKARNAVGIETDESAVFSTWTLAAVSFPQEISTFTDVFTSSLTVNWSSGPAAGGYNGPGAQYLVEASSVSSFATITASSLTYNVWAVLEGLNAVSNQTYSFRVKAANNAGVWGDYLVLGSTITGAIETPTDVYFDEVSTASITASAYAAPPAFANLGAGYSGVNIAIDTDTWTWSGWRSGDKWTSKTALGAARYYLAAAAVGGRIYIIGGAGGTATNEEYDPATNARTAKTAMPTPRTALAAAAAGGRVYAIGMSYGGVNEEYDPLTNAWSSKAAMPTQRQYLAVAAVGGKIYALGGNANPYNQNEEYDPAANTWSAKTPMPTARQDLAAAAAGGRVYAIGGYFSYGVPLATNEEYDPAANSWVSKTAMPTARQGLAASVVGGRLYAVGGYTSVSVAANEEYDPAANTWSARTAMPAARSRLAAAAVGGRIYALGGYTTTGVSTNEEYDPGRASRFAPLVPNTQYTFKAKARNADGIETGESSPVSKYTLAAVSFAQDVPTFTDVFTSSLTVNWSSGTAAGGYNGAGAQYLVQASSVSSFFSIAASSLTYNLWAVLEGLTPLTSNALYYFRVKAANNEGVWGGYFVLGSTLPSAAVTPTAVYFDEVFTTSITASAYASPPAFANLDSGLSGVNIAIDTDTWTWSGWRSGDKWTSKTAISPARYGLAAAAVGGRIYIIGGYGGTTANEEYDPVTNVRTAKTAMPTGRSDLAAAAVGGRIYAIGGYTNPYNQNEEYDPASNTWAVKTPMPSWRYYLAAAAAGGRIYALGGYSGDKANEEYDPATNTWAVKTAMPTGRRYPAAAAVGGKIYVIGGNCGGSDTRATNEEYDPAANSWAGKTPMPTARYSHAAAAAGGRIYVMGGTGGLAANEEYDPAANVWAVKADMPTARYGLAAVAAGGRIYAVGGYTTGAVATNEEYDPGRASRFAPLVPNTQYSFKAKARNVGGAETAESPVFSTWTLAAVAGPQGITTFTDVFTSSLTVNWSSGTAAGGYNGSGAQYLAQASTNSSFYQVAASSLTYNIQAVLEGLTGNLTYYFRVKAANNAGAWGDYFVLGSTVIGVAETPAVIYFDEVSTISITASAYAPPPAFANLNMGLSGINIAIDTDTWTWAGWHGEKWTTKAVMTTARYYLAAAAAGGRIYALGGYAPAGNGKQANEEYDPSANSWAGKTAIPTGRTYHAAAASGGRIYVLGGWYNGSTPLAANEEYDPAANAWAAKAAMPTARIELAAAAAGGRIYALGGYTYPYTQNEEYDPATNTWAVKANMLTGRYRLAAAASGGRIYAIGGSNGTQKNEEYDPATDSWASRAAVPTGRTYFAAAALGGRIYALGGQTSPYNQNEEYDPGADAWVVKAAMPTGRYQFAAAASGGRIYVIGGNVNPYNQNEEYDPGRVSKFSPLVPNTQYSFKARARSVSGAETGDSPVFSTWTLAAVSFPQEISTFTDVFTSSLTVNWSSGTVADGYSGPGAQYLVQASSVSSFASITASSQTYSLQAVLEGLTPLSAGAFYYFRVKAANNAGVWGDYLVLGSTMTGAAATPTAVYFDDVSTISITASAYAPPPAFANLGAGFSGVNIAIDTDTWTWSGWSSGDKWTTKTLMTTARSYPAAASVGGRIYVIGGKNGQNANEEYNPASNSWSARTSMPTGRYELAAAVADGRIYAIGGWTGSSYFGNNEEYDPVANTWAVRAAMPTKRAHLAAATAGGRIYAISGTVSPGNKNEEYDPASDSWAVKTSLPTARYPLAAASVGGRIYALGGTTSIAVPANEEYDPVANTWAIKAAMPTARTSLAAAVSGGRIYAIGGSDDGTTVRNENEEYDPAANAWVSKPAMPTARLGLAAAAAGGRIYAIGGYNAGYLKTNEEYDPGRAAKFSPLVPNTQYSFKAKSRNADGAESGESAVFSTYTLAAVAGAQGVSTFTAVFTSSLTVHWSSGTASGGYNAPGAVYLVQASTSSSAFVPVAGSSQTSNIYADITGLAANTTYFFRVRAANNGGVWGPYLTLVSTPTAAAVPGPAIPPFTQVSSTAFTVRWEVNNPTGTLFACQISSEPAFIPVWATSNTYNSYAGFTGLYSNTTYYAKTAAKGRNNIFSDYYQIGSTATLSTLVKSPVIYAVFSDSATVNWVPSPASPSSSTCQGYLVQACADALFFGNIYSSSTADYTISTLTVEGLLSGVTYYFRVGSLNRLDAPNYALAGSTVMPGAATPRLVSPADGLYVTTTNPVFMWAASIPDYQLQVADNTGFSPVLMDSATAAGSVHSTVAFETGGIYYWRVRGGGQTSSWSPYFSVKIDTAPPQGQAYQSFSSSGVAIVENQFNDLTAGVTAQLSVIDAVSGLDSGSRELSPVPGTVGLWHMNEWQGAPADSSGWLNHSTYTSAAWTQGMFGGGLDFQGTRRASLPGSASLDISGNKVTMQAWIKRTGDGAIVTKDNSYLMAVNSGKLQMGVETTASGSWSWAGSTIVPSGVWTFVTCVYDGTSVRFYINGEFVGTTAPGGSQTGDITPSAYALVIGNRASAAAGFNGVIDEARVLNTARTDSEIRADYMSYQALVSTNAGASWLTAASTAAVSPRIDLSGPPYSTSGETLKIFGMTLPVSTNSQTCGGSSCGAMNQVKFMAADAAGNILEAGPYALLVSTFAALTGIYFDEISTTAITASAYAPPPAFSGLNIGFSGINVAVNTNTWTWAGWRGGDKWTTKDLMATARYELAAAAAGGKIYALGGQGGTTINEEYDPAANSWSPKTSMPTARYRFAAAAAGGKIYAIGGYTNPYNQHEEYDPLTNTWAAKAVMPTGRYGLAAASVSGRIYALGGYSSPYNQNEEYDPATNSWASKTAMPTARRYLAAAVAGGKIYAVGGYISATSTSTAANEEYDPAVNTWVAKADMPTRRQYLAAAAAGGRIYAIGGDAGPYNQNEEYDPAANSWALKPAMPTGRYSLAAAAAGGRIYAIGGYTSASVAITEEYDSGTAARFAGLLPNTQYTFKAKARNAAGYETGESPEISTPTLAAVAAAQGSAFTDVFTSSLTVNWSSGTAAGGYNGPGAKYLVEASSASGFPTVKTSSLTCNLQAGLEGLTGSLTYYFRIKAANIAGVWGDYLVLGSTVMGLIETPTAVYFDEVSTVSITAAAYAPPPAFANLNMGLSGTNIAIDTDTWTWAGWHGEKWTVKAVMPTGRSSFAAAAVGGKIYAIGGYSVAQTNEEYDPAADSWAVRAAMPTGRSYFAVAAAGGKIYALGGNSGTMKENEEYDPASDAWVSKAAMPTGRRYLAAAASGGRIYALGGDGGAYNLNEEYDPLTDTWASKAVMLGTRYDHAAVALGGRIYAMGGSGASPYNQNEEYNPAANSWAVKAVMPTGRRYLAAAALGGRIYVMGGYMSASPYYTAANEEYDPVANIWAIRAAVPTARYSHVVVAAGGRIYAIGGYGTGNSNEEYDPGRVSKFTGLAPNTQYTFKAKARNSTGAETDESPVFSTYTLAAVSFSQDVSTFTDVFTSSLTVNWSSGTAAGGYNGSGARYLVQASSVSSFASIAASSLTYNIQAVLEGLAPLASNELYYFRVKAVNSLGVWGDYLVLGSTMPGAAVTPTVVYFDEVSTTVITAAAYAPPPAFANLNAGLSGINVAISTDTWTWSGWRNGDVWTAKTAMPTKRYFLAAAAAGGRIYAIGGYTGSVYLAVNEEYDPAADVWVSKTAMPAARYSLAAAAAGGRVYAIGGTGGTTANEEYDPAANTWAAKAAMPTARYSLAAAAVGGRIYAIGGNIGASNGIQTNEEYDPAADAWVSKAAMPTARSSLAAAVAGGRIYAIGGYTNGRVATNEEYDPAADSWVTKTAMPAPREALAAAALGGRIYALGGYTGSGYLTANEEYDPAANAWVAKAAMPSGRHALAAASAGGRIYAIGGSTGSITALNEEYDPGTASRFTGLVPNTQYSFKAKARNAGGAETDESPVFSTWTLAAVAGPQGISAFTDVFTSSLTVNWSSGTVSGGYNAPGAQYLVQASSVSAFVPITASSLTYNIQAVLEGLTPLAANKPYYFRVKAANNGGAWGNYLVLGSTMTGAIETPTTIYFDEVSTTAITAAAYAPPPAFTGLDSGVSGINMAIDTNTWTWAGWRGGDVWTVKTAMPTARYSHVVASVGGKIYAMGGYFWPSTFAVNEEYDPAADSWAAKTAMPSAASSLAVVVVGGKIYAMGGSVNREYDPAADTWASKAEMPTAVSGLAAAAVGGKIYAMGGSVNREYNPATDSWVVKTAMPTGRSYLAAAAVGGKIYAMGGSGGTQKENEEYDPAANSWVSKTALPTSRYGLAAVAVGGRIYALGGVGGMKKNEEYDPAANTWASKPEMPTGRYYLAAAAAAGRIYAVGGSTVTNCGVAANEEYDPGTGARFAPLVPNTQYSFKAKARNVLGAETDESPVVSTYTLAAVAGPQGISTFTDVFTSSLTVNWSSGTVSGGYNAPGAQYLVQASTVSSFASITASSLTYNIQAVLEGLTPLTVNKCYYFRVRAANTAGAWGGYLVLGSTMTGTIETPTTIYFDEVSTTAITAAAYAPLPAFTGLDSGVSGINMAIDTNTWTWTGWRNGDVWTAKAAMPTGRYNLAAAAAGGKIYAIGGYGGTQKENEEYDPAANAWIAKAAMPTGRSSPAAASVGGRIYVMGGYTGSYVATNEEYDPVSDAWVAKAAMPTNRSSLASASVGGRIYAMGGYSSGSGTLAANEEYDPATDSWVAKTAMPTAISGLAAAVAGGKIYAVVGSLNQVYDPADNSWTSKTAMPTSRSSLAAASVGGRIYALGGAGGTQKNEEYDPADDSWTSKAAMPTGRSSPVAAVVGGRIYVVGGTGGTTANEEYDPGTASSFTGLVPNTQYSFKAKARNVVGVETAESPVVSTYTQAAVGAAQGDAFTGVFISSLTVNWSSGTVSGGYNGPGAQYLVQASSVPGFSSVKASSLTYNLWAGLEGFTPLTVNKCYYFRVKAANNAGVWGDYQALGSTLCVSVETPTDIYFDEVSTVSITAAAYAAPPAFTGLDTGLSGINVAVSTNTWTWAGWRNGGVWTAKTAMSIARQSPAAAAVGGRIYVVGDGMRTNMEYDPASNTWASKTAMPTARDDLAVASVGGKLYAVGGSGGMQKNEEYDPASNTWAVKADMPTGRYSLAAAAVGGKLYAIGGYGAATVNEEYDPATDAWITKAAMPNERYSLVAVAFGGKIYAIGGYSGIYGSIVATNQAYNPATDSWASKAAMPTGRRRFAAAAAGGRIYALGGQTSPFNQNEEYDPAANTWAVKAAMPTARYDLAAASVGGRIYALGGLADPYNQNEEYDPGTASRFFPLLPNTQYSFKAKARNSSGIETAESPTVSTYTLAAVAAPQGISTFTAVFTSSLTVNWSSGTITDGYNGPGAAYLLQVSLYSGFVPVAASSQTNNIYAAITGLAANTTYYFRIKAVNAAGVWGDYVYLPPVSTLAEPVSGAQIYDVYYTSVTLNWLPRPPSPQTATCEGYRAELSTASDFSGTAYSSSTADINLSTLTVSGLDCGVEYFTRVGSLNWDGLANYSVAGSTGTLTWDCGFRFYDATQIMTGACEYPGVLNSRFRIRGKDGITYGIILMDPSAPSGKASRFRIQTPSGPKAVRKH